MILWRSSRLTGLVKMRSEVPAGSSICRTSFAKQSSTSTNVDHPIHLIDPTSSFRKPSENSHAKILAVVRSYLIQHAKSFSGELAA